MRIAVLAPIQNSLYSRLVTHLAAMEDGIDVALIVVRTPWSLTRIRSELNRDGTRLLGKVRDKLLLGGKGDAPTGGDTLIAMAEREHLIARTLDDVAFIHGIRVITVRDHNEAKAERALRETAPDAIVFTGGGLIRATILSIPRLGVLNCHAGILPAYRGMDVVEWPVVEGRFDALGATLHVMDAGVDSGPILLQQKLDVRVGDTFQSLRSRIEPLMVDLVLRGLRGLRDRTLKPRPQNPSDGRQYYVMHPRMKAFAESKLRTMKKSRN
jgi:methionyl-tRNA formyltransferase